MTKLFRDLVADLPPERQTRIEARVKELMKEMESTFAARVCRIDKVENHPNSDRLTLNHVAGHVVISSRKEDGSARYNEGDLVVYVPVGAVIPDNVLKIYGYWDAEKNHGLLDGNKKNRVKARNMAELRTEGLLLPVRKRTVVGEGGQTSEADAIAVPDEKDWHPVVVNEGDDVTELLGITEHKSD